MLARTSVGEGHHRPSSQCRRDGQHRGNDEDALVGAARNDDFLQQQLQAVGDRLDQAPWTDAVGADTDLHVADNLALRKVR
jgi:hypothetical protein